MYNKLIEIISMYLFMEQWNKWNYITATQTTTIITITKKVLLNAHIIISCVNKNHHQSQQKHKHTHTHK